MLVLVCIPAIVLKPKKLHEAIGGRFRATKVALLELQAWKESILRPSKEEEPIEKATSQHGLKSIAKVLHLSRSREVSPALRRHFSFESACETVIYCTDSMMGLRSPGSATPELREELKEDWQIPELAADVILQRDMGGLYPADTSPFADAAQQPLEETVVVTPDRVYHSMTRQDHRSAFCTVL